MMTQEKLAERGAQPKPDNKTRYRTCCNICHIKCGTVFLGVLEALVAIFVLITVIQQIMWKNENSALCNRRFLRDCLIFQFNHFNVTLVFDYIVVLMMIFILLSVLLLMCGILSDTSCLIAPHLAVQAMFLLFSLGYFILHAWSYFYGDLYVHARPFLMQSLIERMWLAALLLILAAFQCYLFSAVVHCSKYISGIEEARRRRESAFERCSERVRIAKENGLWRTTSWGGGFQQYKGQYDNQKEKKSSKRKGFRVQWNFNQNTVVEDEEMPLRPSEQTDPVNSSPPRPVASKMQGEKQEQRHDQQQQRQHQSAEQQQQHKQTTTPKHHRNSKGHVKTTVDETRPPKGLEERRRNSHSSVGCEEVHLVQKEGRIHTIHAEKKEQRSEPLSKHAEDRKASPTYKIEVKKVDPKQSPKKTEHHHHHQHHPQQQQHQELKNTQSMQIKTTTRPPLRTYKSMDSDDGPPIQNTKIAVSKYHEGRRKSSTETEDIHVVTHHVRNHRSPDKKHEVQLVKKVSITATVHP